MIITPLVTAMNLGSAAISWAGTAGKVVRVFVNGALVVGPVTMATASKSVVVSMPDPAVVEVHENDSTETVHAAILALERRPLVWWRSVTGATQYRVYIGGVLVATVLHEAWRTHHELLVPTDVRADGAHWTNLQITAVGANGVEATTAARAIEVPGVPVAPSNLQVTGSAGVFDLELEFA